LAPAKGRFSKGIQRRNEALRRIGVTPEQMLGKAIITPQLKMAVGGLKAVLEALRASDDEDAVAFLSKYDQVPVGDREKLTWEEIAVAAGISPKVLMGASMIALRDVQQNTASIMAMTNHPKIMQKRIAFAKREGGVRDRDAIDTHLGFLPTKNGAVINNRIQVANLPSGPNGDREEREIEVPQDLQMMDDVLPEWNNIRVKLLEGARD